jgi:histone deacetylase complex subunit SAP30
MARKLEYRRQSKEDLAKVARKHFNGLGIQENEVIVGFLHKVKNPGITKPRRNKNAPHASPMP